MASLVSVVLTVGVGSLAAAGPAPPAHGASAGPAKNHFLGAHPLAGNPGIGYCYIDVPHGHDYVPDRPAVYKQVGDDYDFTGDPVPYGDEGATTVFYGHHPVPVPVEVTAEDSPIPAFCFIKGPQYHDYPQPAAAGFKQKDNAVFYVGPIPLDIACERPQAERAVEVEYQPYAALRPQVRVTPPPEWQGVVWVPPRSEPVVVASPVPAVVVPPPSQPVMVAAPAPQVLVAPPAPPTVGVAPAHPPGIIIGAPAPGAVVVGGHGRRF